MLRLLTQRKDVGMIETILKTEKIDYTIYLTTGSWHYHEERSLVIEVFTTSLEELKRVAEIIGSVNRQQAVVIQYIPDVLHVLDVAEGKWSIAESALTSTPGVLTS